MISLLLLDVQGLSQRPLQTHVFFLGERLLEGGMGWHGLIAAWLCQPAKRASQSSLLRCQIQKRSVAPRALVKDCSLILPVAVSPYRAPLEITTAQETASSHARILALLLAAHRRQLPWAPCDSQSLVERARRALPLSGHAAKKGWC